MERLLTPDLAVCLRVRRTTLYAYVPLWPSNLLVVVAHLEERLAKDWKEPKKTSLLWYGWTIGHTQSARFIHIHE